MRVRAEFDRDARRLSSAISAVNCALVLLLACLPASAQAQRIAPLALQTQSGTGSGDPRDFAIEAGAASLGSLVGIGLVALGTECGVEDLGCMIRKAGASGIAGVAGATIATQLAARQTGSPRSIAGAVLGGAVGTGVGLGVHWLLNEGTDVNLDDGAVVPIFVLSQGIFAALGSRMLAR